MTASTGAAPRITVSWGELIDKIAILEIKRERIVAKEAARNVEKELDILRGIAEPVLAINKVAALKLRLDAINRDLWDIENLLRQGESEGNFGPTFVLLARSVYKKNDERAALKRKINGILQSELVEEKSYSTLSPPTTEGGC